MGKTCEWRVYLDTGQNRKIVLETESYTCGNIFRYFFHSFDSFADQLLMIEDISRGAGDTSYPVIEAIPVCHRCVLTVSLYPVLKPQI